MLRSFISVALTLIFPLVVGASSSHDIYDHELKSQSVLIEPPSKFLYCGIFRTPEVYLEMEDDFQRRRRGLGSPLADEDQFIINAHFHNIYEGETRAGGYIEDDVIEAQQKVLDDALAGLNIKLNWAETAHVENGDWFKNVDYRSPAEAEMAEELYKGDRSTLNIYTVKLSETRLGYAYFPREHETCGKRNAIYIRFSAIPGGMANYDMGMSLVHEFGHWAGLWHTFHGFDRDGDGKPVALNGCVVPGDSVDDTPYQKHATGGGCPNPVNSCPAFPDDRNDVHNHMDYSYDACKEHFTAGQATRVSEHLRLYRGFE